MKIIDRNECKKIQLDILDEIVNICDRNSLQYYLSYGSLLGAVRHKGFIPWDDDIDICLFRKDYEQLIKILKSKKDNDIPVWLDIIDGDVSEYYYTFAKAVDSRTIAKMEDNLTDHGIWIDIFPLDNLPDNQLLRGLFLHYCYFLRAVILAMTTDFLGTASGSKTYIKRLLNICAKSIGKKRVYNHYEKICRINKDNHSDYVGMLFSAYGVRDCVLREKVSKASTYTFEDRYYTGYANYDYFLSKMYGDYMKIPPVEKQRTHSIDAHWKE